MERKSERIKEQNSKKSILIIKQIHHLIQPFSCLKQMEKIDKFIEIYQLINNNFELLYELKSGIDFFYIAFIKKEEINAFLKKEINNEKKIKNISKHFFKLSQLFDKKFLEIIAAKSPFLKEKENDNLCPICLDNIGKKEIFLSQCNHCFHKNCILNLLKQCSSISCPICRCYLF
jgi:translation elongation factor EF-G